MRGFDSIPYLPRGWLNLAGEEAATGLFMAAAYRPSVRCRRRRRARHMGCQGAALGGAEACRRAMHDSSRTSWRWCSGGSVCGGGLQGGPAAGARRAGGRGRWRWAGTVHGIEAVRQHRAWRHRRCRARRCSSGGVLEERRRKKGRGGTGGGRAGARQGAQGARRKATAAAVLGHMGAQEPGRLGLGRRVGHRKKGGCNTLM
jgi:hypothetical protein